MKSLTTILLAFLFGFNSFAQQSPSTGKNTLHGIVQEEKTLQPIAYATIKVTDANVKIIATVITDEKGNFKLEGLVNGTVIVEINALGYQSLTNTANFTNGTSRINLGTMFLKQDATLLNSITVTGSSPTISLKLDKKVFDASKDLLAQNGSAIELLNAVPSVNVSPSGGISLRGNSNVLVLINGRRTGLTQSNALDQLPADQIDKVELITNPSSRYDAAGSAGIINIILKKNKKAGFNGQIRLVGGIPNDTRVNPSLNYKSDKINLFSTFGIRLSDYVGLYKTNQSVQKNGVTSLLTQQQNEDRHDDGKLLYVGADYAFNAQNSITAAYLRNATNDHDKTNLAYNYQSKNALDSSLTRNGESWEKRNYNQLEFNYTKLFEKAGRKYTVDLQYDFWNSDKDWILGTTRTFPNAKALPGIRTSSIGASKDLMIQTDYSTPVDSTSNLELGLKFENRKVTSDFIAEQQNSSNWTVIDDINNQLTYNELIGSAYAQWNNKWGKFAYQLGLRSELTQIKIADLAGDYTNNKDYIRLFPTLNLNYTLAQTASIQASYSKRINRPSLNALYPFNELTDFNSRYVGNPDLNPSYADVFEFGFLKSWNKFTFNPSVYYQYNNAVIQDYSYRNAQGIFISTPINIESETRSGIELSTLYNPLKWLQTNLELNFYRFKQNGLYNNQSFDYAGQILTARASTQFKLQQGIGLQLRYNFTGAQNNAQSHTKAIHYIEFGSSKSLFKNKANVSFDITNLFNLRKFNTTTTGSDYAITQINSPNAVRYRLSFVYKLNLKDNQAIRQAKTGNRN